jgi:adenine deaminase
VSRIKGNIVDIHQKRIFQGEVVMENGRIVEVVEKAVESDHFIMPGFVDAHVHVESSMLVPSEFARLAVRHGTVATVSDPHEIANVLGEEGVTYMIENGKQVPFKFYFGAPSCVPATSFETAGASIDSAGIRRLLEMPEIKYLAEMMNYPGVIFQDEEVMAKIAVAHELGKPIDGHAPGLGGEDLRKYRAAGISTDHECFTYEEGKEKAQLGMHILIREGSAAKNFEALIPLLAEYPDQIMFCSDDKHPDDLLVSHLNALAARAVAAGHELFSVLRAMSLHPVQHYGLEVGLLRPGDPADFVVVEDLEGFQVHQTWIDGEKVAESGEALFPSVAIERVNQFNIGPVKVGALRAAAEGNTLRVIEALDGELITRSLETQARKEAGELIADPDRDILKLVMINRYHPAPPAVAFIKGFGLKDGALASCVGHDSHNIIAVGSDDEAIARAINLIISHQGGISAVSESEERVLPLPVAGIMSDQDGEAVGERYGQIDRFAKGLGSSLKAPFMTLSFMGLLVIPALKLSDKGLFDGEKFAFTPLSYD